MEWKKLTDKDWKKRLSPEEYKVLREKGTERAFSNDMWKSEEEGTYCCAACKQPLFSSSAKYISKTGWPSFSEPLSIENLLFKDDVGFFSKRVEVLCKRCESHLGHVFNDGPKPSGKRYCLNAISLKFVKA
jgi:peptide-methionine (R)-S-oxide reductase